MTGAPLSLVAGDMVYVVLARHNPNDAGRLDSVWPTLEEAFIRAEMMGYTDVRRQWLDLHGRCYSIRPVPLAPT